MAGAAVVVLVVAVLYVLRLDRVAGLVVDDAWYILLGQALSQGHGVRLTSSLGATRSSRRPVRERRATAAPSR